MRRGLPTGLLLLLLALPLAAQQPIGPATPASGIGRSPGASALPATPGARAQRPAIQQSQRRQYPRYGSQPIYGGGYGYGGIYIDDGERTVPAPQDNNSTANSANVVTVAPREPKTPPNPRVYDVREDADGNVEMTPLKSSDDRRTPPVTKYWLIALESGTIHAAARYSVDGDTIQFTRRDGTHFVVSRNEVDLPFTEQLNRDLGRRFGDH